MSSASQKKLCDELLVDLLGTEWSPAVDKKDEDAPRYSPYGCPQPDLRQSNFRHHFHLTRERRLRLALAVLIYSLAMLGLLSILPFSLQRIEFSTPSSASSSIPYAFPNMRFHSGNDSETKSELTMSKEAKLTIETFFSEPRLKRHGIFVELGANDGITGSISLFLERELQWSGLLVEGATPNFDRLAAVPGRPHSKKVHSAICKRTSKIKFVGIGPSAGKQVSQR